MRFGTALPSVTQMPGTPAWEAADEARNIVTVAKKADELGYAWLPCSDHVVVPKRALATMGAAWYEPATTLAFVAGVTQRVRLLTHVLILPYHSPFETAKQFATLDRLSGGRIILGVGVGHLRPEFRALGAHYDERGAITDERIRLIDALWTQDETSFDGAHHQARQLILTPRPVQQPRPPIWVGGNSRRAARRAAELGDGWLPWDVTPEDVRDRLEYLERLGLRTTPFEVVVPGGPFTGTRDQVMEQIETYRAAGVTGMTVGFRSRSLEERLEQLEGFAREIMPAST